MAERIVINTGPLITLARMDALDVPGQLSYEFIVTDWEGQNPRLYRASGFLMMAEGIEKSEMASSSLGFWCR